MRRITCLLALPAAVLLVATSSYYAGSPSPAVPRGMTGSARPVMAMPVQISTETATKPGMDASLRAAFRKAQYQVERAPGTGRESKSKSDVKYLAANEVQQ